MQDINLLPRWQDKHAQWFIGLVCSALLSVLSHYYCKQYHQEIQQQITALQQEIRTLDSALIQKTPNSQKFNRNLATQSLPHFLTIFPPTIPIGLYLVQLHKTETHFALTGHAENIEVISQWVASLNKNNLKLSIRKLQQDEKNRFFPITFHADIKL